MRDCAIESGSYRLAGNLIIGDTQTDVIQITADNVTLDLNGFSVPVTPLLRAFTL